MELKELLALLEIEGALKIITNIPNWEFSYLPNTDPRYYVWHDVQRIEGPNHKGMCVAISADYDAIDYGFPSRITRDECMGQPEALLCRLREWRLYPTVKKELPAAPVAEHAEVVPETQAAGWWERLTRPPEY